jgi:hypothetical protein
MFQLVTGLFSRLCLIFVAEFWLKIIEVTEVRRKSFMTSTFRQI